MAAYTFNLTTRFGGRSLPPVFQSISIDEDLWSETYQLTSNQSNVVVNLGPIATGQILYLACDQSMSFEINSGTEYSGDTNFVMFMARTSLSALTLTNNQTNTAANFSVGIFST